MARRRASRRGFTLVEVVVSLGVCGLLMAALGSLVMIGSRALPTGATPAERRIAAAAAVDLLTRDLTAATAVTLAGRNAVGLTVADVTGDGVADTVQYAWAATPGAPLYRQVNALPPLAVLASVQQFDLTYTLRTTATRSTSSSTAAQSLMASSAPLVLTDFSPNGSAGVGQSFRPTLPSGTSSWSITRVGVRMRDDGTQDGVTQIALRLVDPGTNLPTGPLIATATINETSLDSNSVLRFVSTPAASGLPPGVSVAVLVTSASGTRPSRVLVSTLGVTPANQRYLRSSDNGATWSGQALGSMSFEVYGTTTAVTSSSGSVESVESVLVRLMPDASGTPIEAAARTVNRPAAPAG